MKADARNTEIMEERDRLLRSVVQQPVDVLGDIAVLAVALAMTELKTVPPDHELQHMVLLSTYRLRIIQLAEGQYGSGMTLTAGGGMRDTSASALVAQLCERAGVSLSDNSSL